MAKRRATMLHSCDHHVVVADHDRGQIIVGRPAKDGVALASGETLHHFNSQDGTLEEVYSHGHAPLDDVQSTAPETRDGPAQVATPAYRSGWDNIFGKPKGNAMLN